MTVPAVSVVFAACSGIVGATETVIGLLAIPPMLQRGYRKELIVGTITTSAVKASDSVGCQPCAAVAISLV